MAKTSKLGRMAKEAMKAVRAGASKLEKKVTQELRRRRMRRVLKSAAKTAAKTAAVTGVGLLATAAIRKSRSLIAAQANEVAAGKTARKVAAANRARRVKRRAVAR